MVKRFVAQDDSTNCQPLRVYGTARYLINASPDWQFLFSEASSLARAIRVLKLAGEYNDATLNDMRFVAYLYISNTGATSKSESCSFRFYKIDKPWAETLLYSTTGTELPNGYWYISFSQADLGVPLDGSASIMMEVVVRRLSDTYRDRVYLNTLGIFGTAVRIKNDVEFLDISKLDE